MVYTLKAVVGIGIAMILSGRASAQGVVMRVQVRSTSDAQWRVGRELRMRLAETFLAEGIRTPSPLLAATGQGGVR